MNTLLQIGIEVNIGSTGRITEQIGKLAIEKGWVSYIAYARGFKPSKSKTIKIGNKLNVYLHVLQTRVFGNHLRASTKATKELIKNIQIIKPNIIHLHQLHGYFLNLEVLFIFLSKLEIPVVWTLHDCWAFTGHCAHFSLINCNKWRLECNNCPQINKYPKSYVDKSRENFYFKKDLFNSIQNLTIVTVSHWLNKLAKDSFLNRYRIVTIQNGVDTKSFFPRTGLDKIRKKFDIPNGSIILGVGTVWSKSKGFYDYIELRKILDPDVTIVLVGVNKRLGKFLPSGIVGVPRTENIDELASLYSLADIVISLSYQESFGLTPIEGFACGTPAIVYSTTALPELITSDVGLITEPGNILELNNAINTILKNGKQYYKSNCVKRAVNHFDVGLKYEEYFSLYNQLLT